MKTRFLFFVPLVPLVPLVSLAAFATLVACGGRSPLDVGEVDSGPPATPADFVGVWTCDGTASSDADRATHLPPYSVTWLVTFAANPDHSLTMTYRVTRVNSWSVDGGTIGGTVGPYRFVIGVGGHRAAATSGPTSADKEATFSFVSASFEVHGTNGANETSGSLTLVDRVTGLPGHPDVVNATNTSSGSCTKNPELDAGDASADAKAR